MIFHLCIYGRVPLRPFLLFYISLLCNFLFYHFENFFNTEFPEASRKLSREQVDDSVRNLLQSLMLKDNIQLYTQRGEYSKLA